MEVAAITGVSALVGSSFVFWILSRCGIHGSLASTGWPLAPPEDISHFIRVADIILAAYEHDVAHPKTAKLPEGTRLVKQVGYKDGTLSCPPYVIVVDDVTQEILVAIRGMNLLKESDYATFLRAWNANEPLDSGLAHKGFLKSAQWLIANESSTIMNLAREYPGYTLMFAGHSLGAGVASLATIIAASCADVDGAPPLMLPAGTNVACVAFAPPRVASQELSVKFANNIKAVILQDDFVPRTSLPIHVVMGAAICFPCFMAASCIKDMVLPDGITCLSEEALFIPGKFYHVIYTQICSCEDIGPIVRTKLITDTQFGHIVCSMNAIQDHSLVRNRQKLAAALLVRCLVESRGEGGGHVDCNGS